MAKGSMQVYLAEAFEGDLLYDSVMPSSRLGGLGNAPSASYKLYTSLPEGSKVKYALLEVAITSKEPLLPRWKLWFDGIAITREFKPAVTVATDEGVFSKAVFDVKPIYDAGKAEHEVHIYYEGGAEIVVEHVGLLVAYEARGGKRAFLYASGALYLEPGEKYSIKVPLHGLKLESIEAHAYAIMPSRKAIMTLRLGGSQTVVRNVVGGAELYVECGAVTGSEHVVLELEHLKTETTYYPSGAKVSSILVEAGPLVKPEVNVELLEASEGLVKVRVVNRGSAPASNVIVLSMARGVISDRRVLGDLKPGCEEVVELKAHEGTTLVRVVWKYKNKTQFKDIRLRA